ncbi:MAG: polysaccharide deacetylase family protein [Mycobacterium sp.]
MSDLDRRRFLASLAAATVAGVGLAHATIDTNSPRKSSAPTVPAAAESSTGAGLLPPPPAASRVPLPGDGVLYNLPGDGDMMALTVDDGVDSDVVRLYTQFAKDTGIRLTYFVNGVNDSWTDNIALLRPLVESKQIQLANHTWSHPDLTTISSSEIVDQLTRNDKFLANAYGADAKPFFRPPYGNYNDTVRAIAADLGYKTATMWNGSLSDSTLITEDYIKQMADKYFQPQSIVIGHLNHMPVTHVYGTLIDIIKARNLRTVTLDDVFL